MLHDVLSCAKQTLRRAAWAPLGVVVAHGVIAELFGHTHGLDVAMHFLGGAAASFFLSQCAQAPACLRVFGQMTLFGRCLFAFGLTCAAALLWEFAEALSDHFLATQIQTSLAETQGDLALGVAGSLTYLLAEVSRHRLATRH